VRIARLVTPGAGVDRRRWIRRFEAIGFPRRPARRLARSSRAREMLAYSNLSLLPRDWCATTGLVVVDVGAHNGRWSEAVLALAQPERLVALEPTPASFASLQARLGSDPRVVLHEVAAGSEPGTAELNLMTMTSFNSLRRPSEIIEGVYSTVSASTATVRMTPLDDLLSTLERVHLLKIDTQGFEDEVLSGAGETLRKTEAIMIEVMFVEHYVGDQLFHQLDATLRGAGFVLFDLGNFTRARDRRLLWCDAIYLNPAFREEARGANPGPGFEGKRS
jgi:FkbM family methyltransferase